MFKIQTPEGITMRMFDTFEEAKQHLIDYTGNRIIKQDGTNIIWINVKEDEKIKVVALPNFTLHRPYSCLKCQHRLSNYNEAPCNYCSRRYYSDYFVSID